MVSAGTRAMARAALICAARLRVTTFRVDAVSTEWVAGHINVSPNYARDALNELIAEGVAERIRHPIDQRAWLYRLAPEGDS
jgi:DNA-binding MarR family transcriptional regulator